MTSLPPSRSSAAASAGIVARSERPSARPAYTPPSSGSTSRSTTSRPSRRPTYCPTAGSPSGAGSALSAPTAAEPGLGEQPAAPQRSAVAGHAEHGPAGQPVPHAVDRHGRLGRHRVHQLAAETDGPGELDALLLPGQERLGALVHRQPTDRRDPQLPAHLGGAVDEHDPRARRRLPGHRQRRGQPGDAGSDHHDARHLPHLARSPRTDRDRIAISVAEPPPGGRGRTATRTQGGDDGRSGEMAGGGRAGARAGRGAGGLQRVEPGLGRGRRGLGARQRRDGGTGQGRRRGAGRRREGLDGRVDRGGRAAARP